jgi:hypothetical protein
MLLVKISQGPTKHVCLAWCCKFEELRNFSLEQTGRNYFLQNPKLFGMIFKKNRKKEKKSALPWACYMGLGLHG